VWGRLSGHCRPSIAFAVVSVLSLKPGHDGTAVFIEDGRLVYSLEAEKNSFLRYADVTAQVIVEALTMAPRFPDVLAIGGWHNYIESRRTPIGAGYFGVGPGTLKPGRMMGREITLFSSSHERSHIFMAAGMYAGAPVKEAVILVWEGRIGSFYLWRDSGRRIDQLAVMKHPGAKYSALFALADPSFAPRGENPRHDYAGKLMALAAFGRDKPAHPEDVRVVERLLAEGVLYPFAKHRFEGEHLYDCGMDDQRFRNTAAYLTERIFNAFQQKARRHLPRDLPLLINGGCGLNCDWNTQWHRSGLFTDVFVPPCTNDSGSAIGTALDALAALGEPCRLRWSVDAGSDFEYDVVPSPSMWEQVSLDAVQLADRLAAGDVVAWVQGRCEIGPRALGHRSLLADATQARSRDRLNAIKGREAYRPIAPCCREEDFYEYFDAVAMDPYMLHFAQVKTPELPAITHVDGYARAQAVSPVRSPRLHELLGAMRGASGQGVLCNTSLNFCGRGFINRMSDLERFCVATEIDQFVVEGTLYRRRHG
jgi:hydroxymethyl cephem carbamoyltransferase